MAHESEYLRYFNFGQRTQMLQNYEKKMNRMESGDKFCLLNRPLHYLYLNNIFNGDKQS